MTDSHKKLMEAYRELYKPLLDHVKNLREICKDKHRIVARDFMLMYEEELLAYESFGLELEKELERMDRDVSRERRNLRSHCLPHEDCEDGEDCECVCGKHREGGCEGELRRGPYEDDGEQKEREVRRPWCRTHVRQ